MEEKSRKSIVLIILGIVAILVVVGVAWFIIRGNNKNNNSPEEASEITAATRVTADELAADKVTDIVNYGDYTAMFTLSKAIQNGEKVGAIVSVDGVVSHKGFSYSVGQNNPKKGETEVDYYGTVFNIEDSDDYPEDEAHIKITAKVLEVSPLNFQLVTLKDFVKEVN